LLLYQVSKSNQQYCHPELVSGSQLDRPACRQAGIPARRPEWHNVTQNPARLAGFWNF